MMQLKLDQTWLWERYDRAGIRTANRPAVDRAGDALRLGEYGDATHQARSARAVCLEFCDWEGAAACLFVIGLAGNVRALATAALELSELDWRPVAVYNQALALFALGQVLDDAAQARRALVESRRLLSQRQPWGQMQRARRLFLRVERALAEGRADVYIDG